MFYSKYASISCRFWDIQCRKISRPWNPIQQPFKVIESGTTGYSFLLVFYSNFVHNTCIWDIRLQKSHDLENRIRDQSRSLKMSSSDRAHMTSYWRSIVNMALSIVVSEIFNVENYRDLEIRIRGQSRSLKVVPFEFDTWYTGYGFLLVSYNNFVPKTHHFWDIRLQMCRDLENWVRSRSRSLKMSPFDRAHMTSY